MTEAASEAGLQDLHLQGFAELTRKLRELGGLEDGKAIRASVRAGMGPALKEARSRAPVAPEGYYGRSYKGRLITSGFLKRNLKIAAFISKDKQAATAMLGPIKEAYYGTQFVERGTRYQKAQPWLAPSLAASSQQGLDALANSLRKWIIKTAQKKGATS